MNERTVVTVKVHPSWVRVLTLWGRPELFVEDVFNQILDRGIFQYDLRDPSTAMRTIEDMTAGHPVRRE